MKIPAYKRKYICFFEAYIIDDAQSSGIQELVGLAQNLLNSTYVKVAVFLKHLFFFSMKINISTTGGFRVGFFQPDISHP